MSFIVGEVLIFDANGNPLVMTPAGEAKVESIQRPGTQFDNVIVDPIDPSRKVEVTTLKRLSVETHHPAGSTGNNVVITDPINASYQAFVDASGNLKVTTPPPTPPPNTDQVTVVELDDVSNDSDTYYIIPNTKTLVISRLLSGSEDTNAGSVVLLYLDEDGTGNNLELITAQFSNGSNATSDLGLSTIGDGTKRILIRRHAYGGGARVIFGQWIGYTKDTI